MVDLQTGDRRDIPAKTDSSDLLVPIFREGELVYRVPEIHTSREHAHKQLDCVSPEVLKLNSPSRYDVGLESSLFELRSKLIERAKQQSADSE